MPIRIHLLGRFEVYRDSAPIPPAEWRGQKPRDLLKILLLAQGRYVSSDQLCEWLWPGVDPESAGANLRSTVSDLRKLLEPELARGRDSTYVLTRHEGYAFDLTAPLSLDLADFERATAATTRAGLESALTLYRGDLLEEDPYAEWALAERQRLRELRLSTIVRLIEQHITGGDDLYPKAVALCEQALAIDAGRETVWRNLMRAHALNGDRAAALNAFDRCRAALSRDLGVDPLPETTALHEAILRGEIVQPRPLPASLQTIPAFQERGGTQADHKWLYRLGAIGIVLWAILTGAALASSLGDVARGTFVSPADPGDQALPYLQTHPEALDAINRRLYVFFPLGVLILPGYLAWFAALRREPKASALAWLGVSAGVLDAISQTLSRAMNFAQVTVLPRAYNAAAPDQLLILTTLWDVLKEIAAFFSTLSLLLNPAAILLLLCASFRDPARRFPRWLIGSGFGLLAFTLLYNFLPGFPFTLALGIGLIALTDLWYLTLALTLWRLA
jgi:DNA-binding SARP family transcriptional activator